MMGRRLGLLFLICWAVSILPTFLVASRRGDAEFLTVVEALGFSLIPFVAGAIVLGVMRKSDKNPMPFALVVALGLLAASAWGNLHPV